MSLALSNVKNNRVLIGYQRGIDRVVETGSVGLFSRSKVMRSERLRKGHFEMYGCYGFAGGGIVPVGGRGAWGVYRKPMVKRRRPWSVEKPWVVVGGVPVYRREDSILVKSGGRIPSPEEVLEAKKDAYYRAILKRDFHRCDILRNEIRRITDAIGRT